MAYVTLTPETLPDSHICCAISDKTCTGGYAAKKHWLGAQYGNGYRFRRLDERAKVFIEYGPAEHAWMPLCAPGWLSLGCFWVSGRYKGQGHGKALLQSVLVEARQQGRVGLVAVVGKKKMHFMSDGQWLLRQGFQVVDSLDAGFCLLALPAEGGMPVESPCFGQSARDGLPVGTSGVTACYSDRCPFTQHYVNVVLRDTCAKRGLPLAIHKLDTIAAAQSAPTPATIFSLFLDRRFITTDISACMDKRFDKAIAHS